MHSLIHTEFAKASAEHARPKRAVASHDRPHAPPRRVRGGIARALVSVASRLDRESARRAVA